MHYSRLTESAARICIGGAMGYILYLISYTQPREQVNSGKTSIKGRERKRKREKTGGYMIADRKRETGAASV